MKFAASMLAVCLAASSLAAGPRHQASPERQEAVRQLRDDLNRAIQNANLAPERRVELERSVALLATKRERGEHGGWHQAMRAIRDLARSEALRPEDREALRKDLDRLRSLHGKKSGKRSTV